MQSFKFAVQGIVHAKQIFLLAELFVYHINSLPTKENVCSVDPP